MFLGRGRAACVWVVRLKRTGEYPHAAAVRLVFVDWPARAMAGDDAAPALGDSVLHKRLRRYRNLFPVHLLHPREGGGTESCGDFGFGAAQRIIKGAERLAEAQVAGHEVVVTHRRGVSPEV